VTRVIHTGDTHVGYRQYHAPERQRDFLAAFEAVVDDAIADDVDAVVHAGDLFHDRRPGLADLQGTVAALRELRDASIPFLAVVGNHESKRDGQWLDLFADLGLAERLDHTPRVVGDTAFYGLDFVPRARRDDLDYDFEPTDATHAALVSHGLFEPFAHADWDTDTLLEESSIAFDAVLLGDNHAPGTERVRDAWVTYCGSTERASASERDDRGYNIVAFDAEQKADAIESDATDPDGGESEDDAAVGEGVAISRRGLETREFVFVDVDLKPGEGTDRVREAVRQYDAEDAVVVVTITGDGEPVTPAPVEELARDDGALVVRVNDQRDVTAESDGDVSFADPDAAVRERVRDLGLSTAARTIDETVRESAVADSNVRDAVADRVADLVDDDELDAFEPAPDDASEAGGPSQIEDDESTMEGESTVASEPVVEPASEPASTQQSKQNSKQESEQDSEQESEQDSEQESEQDSEQESEQDSQQESEQDSDQESEKEPVEVDAEDSSSDDDRDAVEASAGDGDGQASMEEFL
jgi:exonuclease SbcD